MLPLTTTPDILILAVHWQPRALLRAQLIEQGYDVVATDTWATAEGYLRGKTPPRVAIVDLQDLADSTRILRELGSLIAPARVVVLGASGRIVRTEIERLGFRYVHRPIMIRDVVAAVRAVLDTDAERH